MASYIISIRKVRLKSEMQNRWEWAAIRSYVKGDCVKLLDCIFL